MEILDLPAEILHAILVQVVIARGLKRSLRLRLVNHLFGVEIVSAIYASGMLESGRGDSCWSTQFWLEYFTYKVMKKDYSHEVPSVSGRLEAVRKTAEALCRETGDAEQKKLREHVHAQWHTRPYIHPIQPRDFESDTARYLLHGAIRNGYPDVVKKVLSSPDRPKGFFLNWPKEFFFMPMRAAGYFGNVEIIKTLLLSKLLDWSATRLHALAGAIQQAHLAAIELITDPRWGPIDTSGALNYAKILLVSGMIHSEHVDFHYRLYWILKARVSTPIDPDRMRHLDASVLLDEVAGRAIQRVDTVEYLLSKGALVHVPPGTPAPISYKHPSVPAAAWNPLRNAVDAGNEKYVRLFLDHGADPTLTADIVWRAAKRARLDIVRMLVEAGADVNGIPVCASEGNVRPPIELALMLEHEEMCQYLLNNGAVIDAGPDGLGARRLVRRVKEKGLDSMVQFLEDRGIVDPSPHDLLPETREMVERSL